MIYTKQIFHFDKKIADKIAKFGWSWSFIITFLFIIVVRISSNIIFDSKARDQYPFILLNLVLFCVAALQAPVIMMSQNRQFEKDRLKSENDYKIDMKSETEIALLHDKLDHLLMKKWQTLLDIQETQLELLQKIK